MRKTYVARRDRLKVGHEDQLGEIHGGEAFPAREVTHSLVGLGWVTEGRGTVPVDDATHGAFASGELGDHAPADPEAIKAFKKAQVEIAALSTPEAETPKAKTPAPKTPKTPKAKKVAEPVDTPPAVKGKKTPKAKTPAKD